MTIIDVRGVDVVTPRGRARIVFTEDDEGFMSFHALSGKYRDLRDGIGACSKSLAIYAKETVRELYPI
jgi:hypothetical protein